MHRWAGVLDEVDTLGLRDNTIVVFLGDHGYHLGENRLWTKMSNFEHALRAPLIVSVPGQKNTGKTSDALVEFVDVYPTLAELAGLKAPETLEGLSMKPLLDAPDLPWKRAAFSLYGRASRGSRHRPEIGDPLGRSIRTDHYRYTEWKSPDGQLVGRELYDMKTDVENNINLANRPEYREWVERLSRQLADGWKAALPEQT